MLGGLLLPMAMVCLQAQAPPPASLDRFTWQPLLSAPEAGVDLRYCTQMTPDGLALRFRNFGSEEVFFDAYVPGLQAPEQAVAQGRIQVSQGKRVGPILLPAPGDPGRPPALLRIRLGTDSGAYWRE